VGLELSRLPYEQENARDDKRKNHWQEPPEHVWPLKDKRCAEERYCNA